MCILCILRDAFLVSLIWGLFFCLAFMILAIPMVRERWPSSEEVKPVAIFSGLIATVLMIIAVIMNHVQ